MLFSFRFLSFFTSTCALLYIYQTLFFILSFRSSVPLFFLRQFFSSVKIYCIYWHLFFISQTVMENIGQFLTLGISRKASSFRYYRGVPTEFPTTEVHLLNWKKIFELRKNMKNLAIIKIGGPIFVCQIVIVRTHFACTLPFGQCPANIMCGYNYLPV